MRRWLASGLRSSAMYAVLGAAGIAAAVALMVLVPR